MAGYAAGNHATVGMRRPSGEYERPIPGTRLFRTKPGNFVELLFTTDHAFTAIKR